jgi:hypothetical protein
VAWIGHGFDRGMDLATRFSGGPNRVVSAPGVDTP